jgi:RimJ/RimL family protein N-acetyltransferase
MLDGKHTALRAIEEVDLPSLLTWRNDPRLRRYFREYRELNSHQQQQWFQSKVNGDLGTRMFAIVERPALRLIGAAGLCYIDWVNRSADFSIYLGADGMYIDRHLAPDAARCLIAYGFDELGLNRLWSEIYEFDERKVALFSELGFQLEGRHRRTHWAEGRWHDSLFFGLLASDARPKPAAAEAVEAAFAVVVA